MHRSETKAVIEPALPAAIERAADHLRAGDLVALPTETVYGLGADATNAHAVARIFEAKGRPRFNPLIAHVSGLDEAREIAHLSGLARAVTEAFWPGPLTIVAPKREDAPIADLVTAGLDTVALRAPSHTVAQALLRTTGRPIAAPSANVSGRVSPTTALHVAEGLGDKVAMILDGGPCAIGLESTIVGVFERSLTILRPGAITAEMLEKAVGPVIEPAQPGLKPTAPGQLTRHYAPATPVILNATRAGPEDAVLAFGPDPISGGSTMRNLSADGSLIEAAANLFRFLRELDASGARRIAVMPIPQERVGVAINDRLTRAAATAPDPGPSVQDTPDEEPRVRP